MRAYLFRGLAGRIFSTGMDSLAKKLNQAGHVATVHGWIERQFVEDDALSQYQANASTDNIAIIGHSLGGNSANYMAINLVAKGVPVTYVATIDATAPRNSPAGVVADNFMSHDIRAEKVPGAVDYPYPHLNHIQIDKNKSVHNQIIAACQPGTNLVGAALAANPQDIPIEELTRSLTDLLEESPTEESNELLDRLLAQLATDDGHPAGQVEDVLSSKNPEHLPVNFALGKGIGDLLNGRKTAFGLIGLLGTTVLPIMFPQLAPVKAVLESMNPGSSFSIGPNPGNQLFLPIFSALGGWGLLGKVEKWLKLPDSKTH